MFYTDSVDLLEDALAVKVIQDLYSLLRYVKTLTRVTNEVTTIGRLAHTSTAADQSRLQQETSTASLFAALGVP